MLQSWKNKKADNVIRRLIREDSSPALNLEAIVADPHLFDHVKLRINAERRSQTFARPSRRLPTVAFASIGVFLSVAAGVGVFGVLRLRHLDLATVVAPISVPEVLPDITRPDFLPKEERVGKLSSGRVIKAQYISESPTRQAPGRKFDQKIAKDEAGVAEAAFYALSPSAVENVPGMRVVRVVMPRSSLFAMGVNVPLENGPDMVKADLMVGPDGMTRAIRVVQ